MDSEAEKAFIKWCSSRTGIVVVELHSETCLPCVRIARELPELQRKLTSYNVEFRRVDTALEWVQSLGRRLAIQALPAFLVYHKDQLLDVLITSDAWKLEKFVVDLLRSRGLLSSSCEAPLPRLIGKWVRLSLHEANDPPLERLSPHVVKLTSGAEFICMGGYRMHESTDGTETRIPVNNIVDVYHSINLSQRTFRTRRITTNGDPPPYVISAVSATPKELITFGPLPTGRKPPQIHRLNLESFTWTEVATEGTIPPFECPLEGYSATFDTATNCTFVFGGGNEAECTRSNYMLIYDHVSGHWTMCNSSEQESLPLPRYRHLSLPYTVDNKVWIFGGEAGPQDHFREFNDIWTFDVRSGRWTCLAVRGMPPKGRTHCSGAMVLCDMFDKAAVTGGTRGWVIAGGKSDLDALPLTDTWLLTIDDNPRWFPIDTTDEATTVRLNEHAMASEEAFVMCVGGILDGGSEELQYNTTAFVLVPS